MVPRLCNSLVIQDNSIGFVFNGLLAELPTRFFTSTISEGWSRVDGSHQVAGKIPAV